MGWKILPLTNTIAPKLLLRSQFGQDGYCVELADTQSMWKEQLSRADIVQRASDYGSAIDPGEDDEQLDIFYAKIQSALNCEEGTSLRLKTEDFGLVDIEIEAALPRPLAPFKWTIRLKDHRGSWGDELIMPFVLKARSLQSKIEQLVTQLHDKDRVISKICDRLETSGNDLTAVFPGASNIKISRKKGQREQLAKHVKGLEDFDEAAWKSRNQHVESDETVNDEVINDIFADLPHSSRFLNGKDISDWVEYTRYEDRDDSGRMTLGEHMGKVDENDGQHEERNYGDHGHDPMRIDQFQRQHTPPLQKRRRLVQSDGSTACERSKSAHENRDNQAEGDSTTDDEDDLDSPHPRSRAATDSKTPEKAAPGTSRKLGRLGGKVPQQSLSERSTANENATPSKPRAKLGAIGGKSKRSDAADDHPTDPIEAAKDRSPTPKPKPTLGAIGGKNTTATVKTSSPAGSAPVSPRQRHDALPSRNVEKKKKSPSPVPEETAAEMADRKRDQLKRDLEQKAKVPAKKKRKF